MLEKFKSWVFRLWAEFLQWLTFKNVCIFLLELAGIVGIMLAILFACQKVYFFITSNYELLLLCGSIIGGFAYWAYSLRQKAKEEKAAQLRAEQNRKEEAEKQHLEDFYNTLKVALYQAINSTASATKLAILTAISCLDSPMHYVHTNGYISFVYHLAKVNPVIDIQMLKEVLNNRIRQMLNAGEITGITQAFYLSNGRPYSAILIHSISDLGGYLQLEVVIVGDNYIRYIENKQAVETAPMNYSDFDF